MSIRDVMSRFYELYSNPSQTIVLQQIFWQRCVLALTVFCFNENFIVKLIVAKKIFYTF